MPFDTGDGGGGAQGNNVLRLLQLEGLPGTLTGEQVAVTGGLLHNGRADGVSLLKDLL